MGPAAERARSTPVAEAAPRGPATGGRLVVLRPGKESADVVITHGGREFLVRPSMAQNFLDRARRVMGAGESELVPLLHEGGVDLLFVNTAAVITVDRAEGITA